MDPLVSLQQTLTMEKYRHAGKRQITQYTLEGEKIAVHDSIVEAAAAIKRAKTGIWDALNERRFHFSNCIWRYGNGPRKINTKALLKNWHQARTKGSKEVSNYDPATGIRIDTFYSINEACRQTGAYRSGIINVLNGKGQTACGFKWAYGKKKKIK